MSPFRHSPAGAAAAAALRDIAQSAACGAWASPSKPRRNGGPLASAATAAAAEAVGLAAAIASPKPAGLGAGVAAPVGGAGPSPEVGREAAQALCSEVAAAARAGHLKEAALACVRGASADRVAPTCGEVRRRLRAEGLATSDAGLAVYLCARDGALFEVVPPKLEVPALVLPRARPDGPDGWLDTDADGAYPPVVWTHFKRLLVDAVGKSVVGGVAALANRLQRHELERGAGRPPKGELVHLIKLALKSGLLSYDPKNGGRILVNAESEAVMLEPSSAKPLQPGLVQQPPSPQRPQLPEAKHGVAAPAAATLPPRPPSCGEAVQVAEHKEAQQGQPGKPGKEGKAAPWMHPPTLAISEEELESRVNDIKGCVISCCRAGAEPTLEAVQRLLLEIGWSAAEAAAAPFLCAFRPQVFCVIPAANGSTARLYLRDGAKGPTMPWPACGAGTPFPALSAWAALGCPPLPAPSPAMPRPVGFVPPARLAPSPPAVGVHSEANKDAERLRGKKIYSHI